MNLSVAPARGPRYHAWIMPRRGEKTNPNGAGTDARLRSDGRYETRATLNTPTGRRRVSFYGATAKEANDQKFKALADQAAGQLFTDPGRLKVGEYLQSWLTILLATRLHRAPGSATRGPAAST
jgi:hypothetical protein